MDTALDFLWPLFLVVTANEVTLVVATALVVAVSEAAIAVTGAVVIACAEVTLDTALDFLRPLFLVVTSTEVTLAVSRK